MSISERLIGKNHLEVEQRAFNLFFLVNALGGLFYLAKSIYLDFPFINNVASGFYLLANASTYYYSKIKENFGIRLVIVNCAINLVCVAFKYFSNGGYQGNSIYNMIVCLTLYTLLVNNKYNAFFFISWVANIYFCYLLEYLNPDWVIPFSSKNTRLLDFASPVITTIPLYYIALSLFKGNYDLERANLRKEREKLRLLNDEMNEKNEQLNSNVEELNKKNQLISTLLRELNHRVKNNLQVVSGLLQMQAHQNPNPQISTALQDGKNRLMAMALLHKKLYEEDQFQQVCLADYLHDLLEHIISGFLAPHIHIHEEIDDIYLYRDQAVPVGLIVNEILTNIHKHAFDSTSRSPSIHIIIKYRSGFLNIDLMDNGKGINEQKTKRKQGHLGMELVALLVRQLEGEWKLGKNGEMGTLFSLRFRVDHVNENL